MMVFSLLMLSFLFIFVIPKLTAVFEDTGMQLPWYSVIVIDFSGFLVNYWHVIFVFGISMVFLYRHWKNTPAGRAQYDKILLQLPVVGPMSRMIAISRFTRTLSTLLTGGVPMLVAMDIVRNVVDNAVLAKALEEARDNISEGESVAGPLKKSGQFPPVVMHMISIGEKTGELENMLNQLSDSFDFQIKNKVDGLTSILGPVMIVVMGGVIGVIVLAVMVPMFELSNLGGQ
jgi:general secretion pathway protein F